MAETTAVFYAVLKGEMPPGEELEVDQDDAHRENVEPAR
jgi:hypothetical protein